MTQEKVQEFTLRISQANPTEMVVVIYDIALNYMDEAITAINNDDSNKLNLAVMHIRRCINELIASLNYAYSPAMELLELYIYCSRGLGMISNNMDCDKLEEIIKIFIRLRDAYDSISGMNTSGAVMENSQSVYAGLTYGRGTLNEDVLGSGNRGFLA